MTALRERVSFLTDVSEVTVQQAFIAAAHRGKNEVTFYFGDSQSPVAGTVIAYDDEHVLVEHTSAGAALPYGITLIPLTEAVMVFADAKETD